MPQPDTKDAILDAAEKLFAEQGFDATSLRQLTTAAGVNLAAVNYHFGSKDELAHAVLLRRIEPINAERRRRLDELPATPTLEQVARAFIEPAMAAKFACADGRTPAGEAPMAAPSRMFGRIMVEQPPFLRGFLTEQFSQLGRRFVAMFEKAAPGIAAETVWWRLHFTVGAMAHTLHSAHAIGHVSGGICDPNDNANIVEQLIAFTVGGFGSKEKTT